MVSIGAITGILASRNGSSITLIPVVVNNAP